MPKEKEKETGQNPRNVNRKGARMEENRQLAVVMRWFDDVESAA